MRGICTLSVIPVRKEASDRAEMVTQILFGEQFEILATNKNWSLVKLYYDDYEGWIDAKQITHLDENYSNELQSKPTTLTLDLVQLAVDDRIFIPLLLGSTLPDYHEKIFEITNTKYSYEGSVRTLSKPEPRHITEHAFMYHHAPYLWGGKTPFGIDCSGFTQMVFKLCCIKLKRDAHQQAEQGTLISEIEKVAEGDLAFFKNETGKVVHVGIILSGNRIIHASGKVRVDKIDAQGIFNEERKSHTHSLSHFRRISE